MIAIDRDLLEALVAEARLAPSAHNIQPTRVGLDGGAILLSADPARRLPAADPTGHDVRLSHGAFLEGLSLALGRRGLALADIALAGDGAASAIARLTIAAAPAGEAADPLERRVATRASWRGGFRAPDAAAGAALERLRAANPDLLVVDDRQALRRIGALADRAALALLSEHGPRTELLAWMRLSKSHPDYHRDGLNAEAMALGRIEAFAAGLVLGPLFAPLSRLGLAASLVAEARKSAVASALVLFHRPGGEDPLVSGRAFYRAWLGFDAEGFAACPMSVLVDWPEAKVDLTAAHPPPAGRRLVNVFRIGLPDRARPIVHSRLSVAELLSE